MPSSCSLSSIETSAVSDWASRSMIPSECAGIASGRREVRQAERGPDHPPVGRGLQAVQHAPEQPELGVRLGPVEPARDVRQRRARRPPAPPRPPASAASRWGGRRSPCPSRCRPSARRRARRRARSSGSPRRTASRATSSQVAAAPGSIQSASPAVAVRGVVVDDHPRQRREQARRCRAGHLAHPLGRRAVGEDEQVVGLAPGPGPCGTGRSRA